MRKAEGAWRRTLPALAAGAKPNLRFRMGSRIGPTLCLLGMLAIGSAWAQMRAPTQRQGETASGTKPITMPAPLQADAASGAEPTKAPSKPAAKAATGKPGTVHKAATTPRSASKPHAKAKAKKPRVKRAAKTPSRKPGMAPKAPSKPRSASKPTHGKKIKRAPVKRRVKAKSGKSAPAKKPVPAAGAAAAPSLPQAPLAPASSPPMVRPLLGERAAEARYREAVEFERRGEMPAAITAYREAGESGHALAQKKMGDLYGTGNDVVKRDYETSLRWYDRARKQGIEIPTPFTYPGVRR